MLVCRDVRSDLFRDGQHAGVLARTIVVKRARILALTDKLVRRRSIERQVRPAVKSRFVKSDLCEHRGGNFDMAFLSRV